jgi:5-methylcytosine-specific restriction endonuclease McrA
MEIAHSRLASLSRNFVEKYADDITFDFAKYAPVDSNPNKHQFFRVIERSNDRMQHLALLTRFLIFEENDGPAEIQNANVMEYIDKYQVDDGIGNYSFEQTQTAKETLRTMRAFYDVFKNDPMLAGGYSGMKELRTEYFILSVYLLLRHLLKLYVWDQPERELFRQFTIDFHGRWNASKNDDADIQLFSNKRQQSAAEIEARHQIIRQVFFDYAKAHRHVMTTKDSRRAFDEGERIAIYRKENGRCSKCVADGKPDKECIVPWAEYDADHVIPHSRGGQTVTTNAQVLCRCHNQQKGANVSRP